MSEQTLSFDDIRQMFRDVAEQSKKTERRFQETALQMKETDRRFQETARQFQETDRQFKETDRKILEVNNKLGKLGNRLGDFIEDAVRPAAVRLFRERGIDVHEVHQDISAQRDSGGIEIDLLVVNDTDVVAIECKSKLRQEDIDNHLERLQKLKTLLPTYANKRVMGAMAAMVIPDNLAAYACRKGLFLIGQNGEHLEIRNAAEFAPAIW